MLRYQVDGGIATLTLSRPKANAFHLPMVAEMHTALNRAERDSDVRAVVVTSDLPRFFSAGFDVAEVFSYPRDKMREFLSSYGSLATRLSRCPKPTVCSIPGHCFAGGTILALCCDFRLMADGEFGIALNEINVGVILSPAIFKLAADVVGPGFARRMFLTGDPVSPVRALDAGLVDEVVPADRLPEATAKLAASLAQKPPATYLGIKGSMRSALGQTELDLPDVDAWYTPEAEERKRAIFTTVKK